MPITIPDNLPARKLLEAEGLMVMSEQEAGRQDIRPIRVAVLNLMPQKVKTETQLARVIGNTPLQVDMTLLTTASYTPRNTPVRHMADFYRTWKQVRDQKFDALVVTGAPVETLPFEDVYYWRELTDIFEWSQTHVTKTLNICWGAQAALFHFYKVPKFELPEKMFGVFPHRIVWPHTDLLRGFDDVFQVPVSRHTEVRRADIPEIDGLTILAESDEAGLCLIEDRNHNHVYMFNHLEYDALTLNDEYRRDIEAGAAIDVPKHYYPDDQPANSPPNTWRAHGHLMFSNWINMVYQTTPYDIEKIGASADSGALLSAAGGKP